MAWQNIKKAPAGELLIKLLNLRVKMIELEIKRKTNRAVLQARALERALNRGTRK